MKQPGFTIPLILFSAFIIGISSCCDPEGDLPDEEGLRVIITNYTSSYYYYSEYRVTKVEFVGTNKVVEYHSSYYDSPKITLNPKDTTCTLRITYENYYEPDSVWSGLVTLNYAVVPDYYDDGCEQKMILSYDPWVSSTSFKSAVITYSNYNGNEPAIQITH